MDFVGWQDAYVYIYIVSGQAPSQSSGAPVRMRVINLLIYLHPSIVRDSRRLILKGSIGQLRLK